MRVNVLYERSHTMMMTMMTIIIIIIIIINSDNKNKGVLTSVGNPQCMIHPGVLSVLDHGI